MLQLNSKNSDLLNIFFCVAIEDKKIKTQYFSFQMFARIFFKDYNVWFANSLKIFTSRKMISKVVLYVRFFGSRLIILFSSSVYIGSSLTICKIDFCTLWAYILENTWRVSNLTLDKLKYENTVLENHCTLKCMFFISRMFASWNLLITSSRKINSSFFPNTYVETFVGSCIVKS